MLSPAYVQLLSRYNAWANQRLYDSCARLTDDERRAPRKAFFGSIHNTLNHILVADRIWLGRVEGVPSGITALDQILHDDFEELRTARTAEDSRIMAFADGLSQDRLDGVLAYRRVDGEGRRVRLALVLAHLFNHQTHHRGQVHDMLSQTDVPPPPLDLIYFPGLTP